MSMNFEKISKFFTLDFFENLIGFIFEESFDSFYERKLNEKRCYIGYDNVLWQITEDDYGSSDVYPINYNYFLNMYNNIGYCTNFVDERLFCIKYLIKELFEKSDSEFLQNDNISIKLNKNIVINEYKKVFITDLEKFDYRLLILNDNPSIDLMVKKFFCFIFDYIQAFLENLLEKTIIDSKQFIDSYTIETKYNIVSMRKNKSIEENRLCRQIKNECKKVRNQRFEKDKGKEKYEILGYFPYNYEKLEMEIKKIKDEYNSYPFIQQQLREIVQGEDRDTVKKNIFDYFANKKDTETYVTLDNTFERSGQYGVITDISEELLHVIDNYIKFKPDYYDMHDKNFSLKSIILYTLLERSGDIDMYTKRFSKDCFFKNLYIDFNRRKHSNKFFNPDKICFIYNTKDFIGKYHLFFTL